MFLPPQNRSADASTSPGRTFHQRDDARFRDVTKKNPCILCGATGWCTYDPESGDVRCRRPERVTLADGIGTRATDKAGKEFLAVSAAELAGQVPVRKAPTHAHRREEPTEQPADVFTRDRAYRAVLAALPLNDDHRRQLLARGLDEAAIARGGYASLPVTMAARKAAGKAARAAAGQDTHRVPGIAIHNDVPTVQGMAGLLVPARDAEGRILGLRVRPDDKTALEAGKYRWISGPKAKLPASLVVHFPMGLRAALDVDHDLPLRLTEGEIKADLATFRGVPTIGLPGIGFTRAAPEVIAELFTGREKPGRVIVAPDADWRKNPDVARGTLKLLDALDERGFPTSLEIWDPSAGKGLDDVLVAEMTAPTTRTLHAVREARNLLEAAVATGIGMRKAGPGTPPTATPDPGPEYSRETTDREPGCDDQAAPLGDPAKPLRRDDRRTLWQASRLATIPAAKRALERAAFCGRGRVDFFCGACGGADGSKILVAEGPACPHCARARLDGYIAILAAETWKDHKTLWHATIPVPRDVESHPDAVRALRKLLRKKLGKDRVKLVRWFVGTSGLLVIAPADVALDSLHGTLEGIKPTLAALNAHLGSRVRLVDDLVRSGHHERLADLGPWLERVVQTGASPQARARLPWPSATRLREFLSEKARGGKPADPDEEKGLSRCCRIPRAQKLRDAHTGRVVAERFPGSFPFVFRDVAPAIVQDFRIRAGHSAKAGP